MRGRGMEIPPGRSYLFTDDAVYSAYAVLRHLMVKGRRGLVLTKSNPDSIPSTYSVDCPIIWIISKPPPGTKAITVDPLRLGKIYSLVADFVKNNPGSAILLDGVELLIRDNDFTSVMKALQMMNESISISGSMLLVPVDAERMAKQEFSFLEREIPPLIINIDLL